MAKHATKHVVNIAEVPLTDRGHGDTFAVKLGRAGPLVSMTGLGCSVHVVPPGKRAFPFHRHHVIDEMFFIVSGEGQYRWGKETYPVRSGDIVSAPAGTQPHQLANSGNQDLRYLAISTMGSVDVVDYPNSGKVAVAAGIRNADFTTATYKGMGRIAPADYWDGEAG